MFFHSSNHLGTTKKFVNFCNGLTTKMLVIVAKFLSKFMMLFTVCFVSITSARVYIFVYNKHVKCSHNSHKNDRFSVISIIILLLHITIFGQGTGKNTIRLLCYISYCAVEQIFKCRYFRQHCTDPVFFLGFSCIPSNSEEALSNVLRCCTSQEISFPLCSASCLIDSLVLML